MSQVANGEGDLIVEESVETAETVGECPSWARLTALGEVAKYGGRRDQKGDCDIVTEGEMEQSSRELRLVALRGVAGGAIDPEVAELGFWSIARLAVLDWNEVDKERG